MFASSCLALFCIAASHLPGFKTQAGLILTKLFHIQKFIPMVFPVALPIPPLGKIPSVVKEESKVNSIQTKNCRRDQSTMLALL